MFSARAANIPIYKIQFDYPNSLRGDAGFRAFAEAVVGTAYALTLGVDNHSSSQMPKHVFSGTFGLNPVEDWDSLTPRAPKDSFWVVAPHRPERLNRANQTLGDLLNEQLDEMPLNGPIAYSANTQSKKKGVITVWENTANLFNDRNVLIHDECNTQEARTLEHDGKLLHYSVLTQTRSTRDGKEVYTYHDIDIDISEVFVPFILPALMQSPFWTQIIQVNGEKPPETLYDLSEALEDVEDTELKKFITNLYFKVVDDLKTVIKQKNPDLIACQKTVSVITKKNASLYMIDEKSKEYDGCEKLALRGVYEFPFKSEN